MLVLFRFRVSDAAVPVTLIKLAFSVVTVVALGREIVNDPEDSVTVI